MRGDYEEPVNVIRRFNVLWSDKAGDYVYELVVLAENKSGERRITDISTGDKKWAKANAKHYNLLVPKAEDVVEL